MELAQAFLRSVVKTVLDESAEDLAFFDERISNGLRATLEHVAPSAFEHLTYTDAVAILERSGQDFEFPVKWGADLQSEHERWLTETHVGRPADRHRLPEDDQSLLHVRERRRPDGARDGRAGAEGRRDHRRLAARGPARGAAPRGSASAACPRSRTSGTSTCAASARCRTRASGSASNGSCST